MKTQDKQFHQLLKKLEVDFGWSFYDEKGKLHLEDLQKQLIGDILKALSPSRHQEPDKPESIKSADEFINRLAQICGHGRLDPYETVAVRFIKQAFEEYLVSDEDIEKWVLSDPLTPHAFYIDGKIEGAKAMRDGKIKPIK